MYNHKVKNILFYNYLDRPWQKWKNPEPFLAYRKIENLPNLSLDLGFLTSKNNTIIYKCKYVSNIVGRYVYFIIEHIKLYKFMFLMIKKLFKNKIYKKNNVMRKLFSTFHYKRKEEVFFYKYRRSIYLYYRKWFKKRYKKQRRILWVLFHKVPSAFWGNLLKKRVKSYIFKMLNLVKRKKYLFLNTYEQISRDLYVYLYKRKRKRRKKKKVYDINFIKMSVVEKINYFRDRQNIQGIFPLINLFGNNNYEHYNISNNFSINNLSDVKLHFFFINYYYYLYLININNNTIFDLSATYLRMGKKKYLGTTFSSLMQYYWYLSEKYKTIKYNKKNLMRSGTNFKRCSYTLFQHNKYYSSFVYWFEIFIKNCMKRSRYIISCIFMKLEKKNVMFNKNVEKKLIQHYLNSFINLNGNVKLSNTTVDSKVSAKIRIKKYIFNSILRRYSTKYNVKFGSVANNKNKFFYKKRFNISKYIEKRRKNMRKGRRKRFLKDKYFYYKYKNYKRYFYPYVVRTRKINIKNKKSKNNLFLNKLKIMQSRYYKKLKVASVLSNKNKAWLKVFSFLIKNEKVIKAKKEKKKKKKKRKLRFSRKKDFTFFNNYKFNLLKIIKKRHFLRRSRRKLRRLFRYKIYIKSRRKILYKYGKDFLNRNKRFNKYNRYKLNNKFNRKNKYYNNKKNVTYNKSNELNSSNLGMFKDNNLINKYNKLISSNRLINENNVFNEFNGYIKHKMNNKFMLKQSKISSRRFLIKETNILRNIFRKSIRKNLNNKELYYRNFFVLNCFDLFKNRFSLNKKSILIFDKIQSIKNKYVDKVKKKIIFVNFITRKKKKIKLFNLTKKKLYYFNINKSKHFIKKLFNRKKINIYLKLNIFSNKFVYNKFKVINKLVILMLLNKYYINAANFFLKKIKYKIKMKDKSNIDLFINNKYKLLYSEDEYREKIFFMSKMRRDIIYIKKRNRYVYSYYWSIFNLNNLYKEFILSYIFRLKAQLSNDDRLALYRSSGWLNSVFSNLNNIRFEKKLIRLRLVNELYLLSNFVIYSAHYKNMYIKSAMDYGKWVSLEYSKLYFFYKLNNWKEIVSINYYYRGNVVVL